MLNVMGFSLAVLQLEDHLMICYRVSWQTSAMNQCNSQCFSQQAAAVLCGLAGRTLLQPYHTVIILINAALHIVLERRDLEQANSGHVQADPWPQNKLTGASSTHVHRANVMHCKYLPLTGSGQSTVMSGGEMWPTCRTEQTLIGTNLLFFIPLACLNACTFYPLY